jgi:hypothetical protein
MTDDKFIRLLKFIRMTLRFALNRLEQLFPELKGANEE